MQWHTHLTNHGYFDYKKKTRRPQIWVPCRDKDDAHFLISGVYLWFLLTILLIFVFNSHNLFYNNTFLNHQKKRLITYSPFNVSSTTSTTLSICCTPTTLTPFRYSILGWACGTHPATTSCLPCCWAAVTALRKWSSAGFFTVQLLRTHRSASLSLSGGSVHILNLVVNTMFGLHNIYDNKNTLQITNQNICCRFAILGSHSSPGGYLNYFLTGCVTPRFETTTHI